MTKEVERVLNFKTFATVQDELNEFTVPNWRQTMKVCDYQTATFAEVNELMESTNWKWWKQTDQMNEWNMKVEMIDIFHFMLSIFILHSQHELQPNHIFGTDSTGLNIGHNRMVDEDGNLNREAFIRNSMALIQGCLPSDMENMFNDLGMAPEEISALYIAKAQLNYIRQETGYKDGNYVKIKDGVEDNERLEDLVIGFLSDKSMSLVTLRENVKSTFYEIHGEET